MKQFLPYILTLAAGMALCGCGSCDSGTAKNSAEIEEARTAARRDAARTARTAENSMEREKSILAMRARESSLRDAGFDDAADAYALCAEKELLRLHIISENRIH